MLLRFHCGDLFEGKPTCVRRAQEGGREQIPGSGLLEADLDDRGAEVTIEVGEHGSIGRTGVGGDVVDVEACWLMATSADLAWDPSNTGLSARLAHWYFEQLLQLLSTDPDTYRRVMLTGQMINNPLTLLHPRDLARLARRRARMLVTYSYLVSGSAAGTRSVLPR